MYLSVFKRKEMKFLLTLKQYNELQPLIENNLQPDKFFFSLVQSVYFDTDDFLLIRRSLEKPVYKEKLRLRKYGDESSDSPLFLEVKKKYDGIVYKRRTEICREKADKLIYNGKFSVDKALSGGEKNSLQINNEIEHFIKFYGGLKPKAIIMCERKAYAGKNDDLRITFDFDIRYRADNTDFSYPATGDKICPGFVLMEVKTGYAMPLWLCEFLSANKIYKTSFSKYGEAYKIMLLNKQKDKLQKHEVAIKNNADEIGLEHRQNNYNEEVRKVG